MIGLGPLAVGLIGDATSYRTAFVTMASVATIGLAVLRAAVRADGSMSQDDWVQDPPDKTEATASIEP